MFLLNISSNYRAKFFIGSALNHLSETGDMYVSSVFLSKDRKGSDNDFYNCCVQIQSDKTMTELETIAKSVEQALGRAPANADNTEQLIAIDIDVLAEQKDASWHFLDKRLPLTDDVRWGLADLQVVLPEKHKDSADVATYPKPLDWW